MVVGAAVVGRGLLDTADEAVMDLNGDNPTIDETSVGYPHVDLVRELRKDVFSQPVQLLVDLGVRITRHRREEHEVVNAT